MNFYIKSKDWEPVDGIYYNQESNEYEIIKGRGNYLVTAGPGAGKTELLAQKATYLLQTNECAYPKKILALSFKVDAKDNIEKRVRERCGEELSKRFISKTYDSFFKGILDQYLYLLSDEYIPNKEYSVLAIKDIDKYYMKISKKWNEIGKDRQEFYRKEYLIRHPLPLKNNKEDKIAKKMWKMMLKGDSGLESSITFPMITRLCQLLINENKVIRDILGISYEYVFLDEFQDTTFVQYDLIRDIFKGSKTNIVAVGDNKQRIMKWAGAKENIFEIYKNDFLAKEKHLLVNHRSAPNLLRLQEVVAEEILNERISFKCNDKWKDNDGNIELYLFKYENEESQLIFNTINKLYENGIKSKDICILVRQTPYKYCQGIIDKLRKYNIDIRYEDDYQDLLREKVILIILDIFRLSKNQKLPAKYMNILNLLKKNNELKDVEKIHYLFKTVSYKLDGVSTEEDLYNVVIYIIDYIGEDFIINCYPQYGQNSYIKDLIVKFVKLMYECYREKNEWNYAINYFVGEESIPIMSIHKSKGLEFNTVFLVGIDEALFWNYKKNKEEELSVFFVGISRAKENLYITSTKNRANIKWETKIVKDFYDLIVKSNSVTTY